MTRTKYIHDYNVKYDDSQHHIDSGLEYLSTISHDEAKVFFDAAHHNGEAQFRTPHDHKFILTYVRSEPHLLENNDHVYTLISESSY
jgi:hypothetical protein